MTKDAYSETLVRLAKERDQDRHAVGPRHEQAAVLYARWQGLSGDPEYLRPGFKDKLDRMIATMHPDEWTHLPTLIPALGERVFKGVLQYALDTANTQSRARHLERKSRGRQAERDR